MQFAGNAGTCPLEAAFDRPVAPLPFTELSAGHRGRDTSPPLRPDALRTHVDALARDGMLNGEALEALNWALVAPAAGTIDLSGHRFVLLGGTAELAPLGLLLSCGADVLTTHTSDAALGAKLAMDLASTSYSGRLFHVRDGVDLLTHPAEFARTALAFGEGKPVHVGALAYKGGQGREWRLAAAMDGIVRALGRAGALASVFYYFTPTAPTEVSADTAATAAARLEAASPITRVVRAVSFDTLYRPNIASAGGRHWARGTLPDQGVSYLAANVLGKIHASEAYDDGHVRVSGNVAPITATRSTHTPVTRRIFPELARCGILVAMPDVARQLMGWMLLYDLFGPRTKAGHRQIHGGVFSHPWALDAVMKQAYLDTWFRSTARSSANER